MQIAHGVGFRFQKVKDIFYEEILRGDGEMPTLFHLHQNFRTHSGNHFTFDVSLY